MLRLLIAANRRPLWAALGVLMALLALLQIGWVLACAYDTVASEQRMLKADSRSALAASRMAVRLAPWEEGFRFNLLRSLIHTPEASEIPGQTVLALQWAASDAYAWIEAAGLFAGAGFIDERLTTIAQEAIRLAPATRTTQTALALIGLRYWSEGDDGLREPFRQAIRFSFEHDQKRFLERAIWLRADGPLCGDPRLPLPTEKFPKNWCAAVSMFRGNCIRSDLSPEWHAWCQSQGYRVEAKAK